MMPPPLSSFFSSSHLSPTATALSFCLDLHDEQLLFFFCPDFPHDIFFAFFFFCSDFLFDIPLDFPRRETCSKGYFEN
jgi:hypothetical protein